MIKPKKGVSSVKGGLSSQGAKSAILKKTKNLSEGVRHEKMGECWKEYESTGPMAMGRAIS
jgi:hypothetical protein